VQPSADAPLAAGVVVGGGYRVVRALAAGGMGTVYEAEQIATGARRALKVMHGLFARDEALRARFAREARLAASVPSEHVAQILDAGQDEATGSLFIVMELLEGSTLSREIRRHGPFAWMDVLEILRQVSHALGAAHALGIVHRDLKPANVFLSRSRRVGSSIVVKLLDFGIAKAVEGVAGEATGTVLGTPSWMAPEQTLPDATVGPPADVWSMGLMAFSLLTGKHFFSSANAKNVATVATMREVLLDPLSLASARAAQIGCADRLPPGFDAWFARCVDRDASERFANATLAYEALALLPAPMPVDPVPDATLAESVDAHSDPPLGSLRLELPVTTAETPRASRVSQMRESQRTAPPASHTTPVPGPIHGRTGLVAGAAALFVLAAVLLVWRPRTPTQEAPTAVVSAAHTTPDARAPIVRLHGSNTIGAELMPALAEAFLKRRTGAATVVRRRTAPDEELVEAREGERVLDSIEVYAHGSATGFTDLAAGACDVAMSSRAVHADELQKLVSLGNLASAASEQVIALDGVAVIVNPSNPVAVLTKAQIADLFAGTATDWSEVGGKLAKVTVVARDDRSGTYDTFKALVLGPRPLVDGAKRYESSDDLSDAVAADDGAIGFIGLRYVRSARAVMIQEAGSAPMLPSPMTVSTEDYPLARRLYLYTPLGAPAPARDLVDFALSEEGQRTVAAAGFVDLRPVCEPSPAECPRCSPSYKDAVRGACRLSIDFRFDRSTSQLDTRALRDLQRIVTMMAQPDNRGRSIVLLGFSDGEGARFANVALSQERASIVAAQLRASGVRVDLVKGLGPEMAVADDSTEDGRMRNRRVEAWLR
jgi:phosphate transport system substrate-binding protein